MLTIEGKAIGQRRPLFEGFSIPPPEDYSGDGPLKLRDVIAHVVLKQVAEFEKRQQSRRLDRVLSAPQIQKSAESGRISPEGLDPMGKPQRNVNPADAVHVALEAFVDGLYLVVIDGLEYRDLDEFVRLTPESRLTFIRLTFLAGA